MLIEFILLLIFVALFFWLIRKKASFFQNKTRFVHLELMITLVLAIFLFLSAGLSVLFLFFLFWSLLAIGSYYIYDKFNEKIGFIGVTFCLFFTVIFIYLEIFLLNFNY